MFRRVLKQFYRNVLLLFSVFLLSIPFGLFAQTQETEANSGASEANLQAASGFAILIVDITQVRSSAAAYISIQQETERVRDLVNQLYQERLIGLEANRKDLLARDTLLPSDGWNSQIAALEEEAIDLEAARRQNFTHLERRRQEAIEEVDARLNKILAELLVESGGAYILNQQSVLVWPDAANVTDQAIILLDEQIPSVNFKITLPDEQSLPGAQSE